LGSFGNVYGCIWANDSRRWLVEENRGAEKKWGIRTSPWKRRRSLLGFLHIGLSLEAKMSVKHDRTQEHFTCDELHGRHNSIQDSERV
jgi:hypothetical protein